MKLAKRVLSLVLAMAIAASCLVTPAYALDDIAPEEAPAEAELVVEDVVPEPVEPEPGEMTEQEEPAAAEPAPEQEPAAEAAPEQGAEAAELPQYQTGDEGADASPQSDAVLVTEGAWGENDSFTWHFYNDGTIYINGQGEMPRIGFQPPWYDQPITRVVIQDGITSIYEGNTDNNYQYGAFSAWHSYKSQIVSVELPDSITYIGACAFDECTKLESIRLPANLQGIGDYAFSGCTKLTGVTLPGTLKTIGASAFSACSLIDSIALPNGLETIGECAFSSCGLTTVTVPASVTSIGSSAWTSNSSLTSVTYNSTAPVPSFGFEWCTALTNVSLADGLTTIEEAAFRNCENLKEVAFPTSLTTIGEGAFSGTGVVLPILPMQGTFGTSAKLNYSLTSDGVLTLSPTENATYPSWASYDYRIPWAAYQNRITKVVVEEGVTAIHSMGSMAALEEVVLPSTLTEMGDFHSFNYSNTAGGAFRSCPKLKKINLPEGLTHMGAYALANCPALTEITLPQTLTRIDEYAFMDCTGLRSIVIPKRVTSIGTNTEYSKESAFKNCTDLTITFTGASLPMSLLASGLTGCTIRYPAHWNWLDKVAVIDALNEFHTIAAAEEYEAETPEMRWRDENGYDWFFTINGQEAELTGGAHNGQQISGNILPGTVEYNNNTYTVTSIGEGAFRDYTYDGGEPRNGVYNCTLQIPAGVRVIKPYAFANAGIYTGGFSSDSNWITEITFGQGSQLREIGAHAFEGQSELTLVALNGSNGTPELTTIGDYAFCNAGKISGMVNMPGKLQTIGNYAFANCKGFGSGMALSASLRSIGEGAFQNVNFKGAVNAEMARSLTSIGAHAFENANLTGFGIEVYNSSSPAYTSWDLPTSLKRYEAPIGPFTAISPDHYNIALNSSIEYIGEGVFVGPGIHGFKYGSGSAWNTIPERWNTRKIDTEQISIWSGTLYNGDRTVLLHGGLNYGLYGNYNSSYDYDSDTTFTMAKTVRRIGDYAFYGDTHVTKITIPASVTEIGDYALDAAALTEIVYLGTPEQWRQVKIGEGNEILQNTTDGNVVRKITYYHVNDGYYYGYSFEETGDTIINRVPSYYADGSTPSDMAFGGWSTEPYSDATAYYDPGEPLRENGLHLYAIWVSRRTSKAPNKSITYTMNDDCLTISGSGELGDAFYDEFGALRTWHNFIKNKGISKVVVRSGITAIGDYAFYGSDYYYGESLPLQSVELAPSVKTLGGGAFTNQRSLTEFSAPGLVSIGNIAFESTGFTEFDMPDTVTDVGYSLFNWNTALKCITLSAGLTSFPADMLGDCESLKTVIFRGEPSSIGDGFLRDIKDVCLYSPISAWPAGVQTYSAKIHSRERTLVSEGSGTCLDPIIYSTHCNMASCASPYCKNLQDDVYVGEHTPGREESVDVPASCTHMGERYTAVYCSLCGEEIEQKGKVELPMRTDHAFIIGDSEQMRVESTCAEEGYLFTRIHCAFDGCIGYMDEIESTLPLAEHTPGRAVYENIVDPGRILPGSHDEAVYCAVCGEEISRETVEDPSEFMLQGGKVYTDRNEALAEAINIMANFSAENPEIYVVGNVRYTENEIFDAYAEREGIPATAGDYAYHAWIMMEDPICPLMTSFKEDGGRNYSVISINWREDEVARQAAVNAKVNALIHTPGGALYDVNRTGNMEQKAKAALDWMAQNTSTHVGEHNSDDERREPINHTAYTVFTKGYGTCQALAATYYRLVREMGVPVKIIAGMDANAHAYTITQMDDGYWYYVDPNNGRWKQTYTQFSRVTEQSQFRTSAFVKNYLRNIKGYTDGSTGTGAITILDEDGNVLSQESSLLMARDYIISNSIAEAAMNTADGEIDFSRMTHYTLRLNSDVTSRSTADFDFAERYGGAEGEGQWVGGYEYSNIEYDFSELVDIDLNGHKVNVVSWSELFVRAHSVVNGTFNMATSGYVYLLGDVYKYNSGYYRTHTTEDSAFTYSNVKFVGGNHTGRVEHLLEAENLFVEGGVLVDESCSVSGVPYVTVHPGGTINCDLNVKYLDLDGVNESKGYATIGGNVTAQYMRNLAGVNDRDDYPWGGYDADIFNTGACIMGNVIVTTAFKVEKGCTTDIYGSLTVKKYLYNLCSSPDVGIGAFENIKDSYNGWSMDSNGQTDIRLMRRRDERGNIVSSGVLNVTGVINRYEVGNGESFVLYPVDIYPDNSMVETTFGEGDYAGTFTKLTGVRYIDGSLSKPAINDFETLNEFIQFDMGYGADESIINTTINGITIKATYPDPMPIIPGVSATTKAITSGMTMRLDVVDKVSGKPINYGSCIVTSSNEKIAKADVYEEDGETFILVSAVSETAAATNVIITVNTGLASASTTISVVGMAKELTLNSTLPIDRNGDRVLLVGKDAAVTPKWVGGKGWTLAYRVDNDISLQLGSNGIVTAKEPGVGTLMANGYIKNNDGSEFYGLFADISYHVYQPAQGVAIYAIHTDEEGVEYGGMADGPIVLDPAAGIDSVTLRADVLGGFDVLNEVDFTYGANANLKVVNHNDNSITITALNNNAAAITVSAKTHDGTGKYKNIVVKTGKAVNGLALDIPAAYNNNGVAVMNVGQKFTPAMTFFPAAPTNKVLRWESSNPSVVTVTSTGLVTAVGAGVAWVTATTQDGSDIRNGFKVCVSGPSVIDRIEALAEQEQLDALQGMSPNAEMNIASVRAGYAKTGNTFKVSGSVGTVPGAVNTSHMDGRPVDGDRTGYYLGFRAFVDPAKVEPGASLLLEYNGMRHMIAEYDQLQLGYADVLVDATNVSTGIRLILDMDAPEDESNFNPTIYTLDTTTLQRGPKLNTFTYANKLLTASVNFDLSEQDSMVATYTANYVLTTTTPASTNVYDYRALHEQIVWASSNNDVAQVIRGETDMGNGTVYVRPMAPGKAVITGTIAGKKITFNATVYNVTPGHALAVAFDRDIGVGLETGQSANLVLKDKVTGRVLNNDQFKFTVNYPLQASVDEAGHVTGLYTNANGAAKVTPVVTATLLNDPAARRVTIAVPAIPHQIPAIRLVNKTDGVNLVNGVLEIDAADMKEAPLVFTVAAHELTMEGEDEVLGEEPINGGLAWTNTDTGIAAVVYNATTKLSTITVKKGVSGEVTLTAAVRDLKKSADSILIRVKDYTPRISTKAVTINPRKTSGMQLDILPSYNNSITNVELVNGTRVTDVTTGLTIEKVPSAVGTYEVRATDYTLARAARNLNVRVTTDMGEFTFPLTVNITPALPAPTIAQKTNFNLFYNTDDKANANFSVAVKNETITRIEIKDGDSEQFKLAGGYDPATGLIRFVWNDRHAARNDSSIKLDNTVTLRIYLDGYADNTPVEKAVAIRTVTTKPNYALRQTAISYNTTLNDPENAYYNLQVYDKAIKNAVEANINMDESYTLTIAKENFAGNFNVPSANGGYIKLGFNLNEKNLFDAAGGRTANNSTATVNVQHNTWRMPLAFAFKVNLVTTVPDYTLSKTKLVMNTLYAGSSAASSLELYPKMNYGFVNDVFGFGDSCTVTHSYAEGSANATKADKLQFTYDTGYRRLTVSAKSGEVLDAGTYSFTISPTATANGRTVAMPKKTIQVQVVNTKPTAKLGAGTLLLNGIFDDADREVSLPMTLNATNIPDDLDAALLDCVATPDYAVTNANYGKASAVDVWYDAASGTVKAQLNSENADKLAAGTYNYALIPQLKVDDTTTVELAKVVVKVTVRMDRPTFTQNVTLTANTSFDALHSANAVISLNTAALADKGKKIARIEVAPNYGATTTQYKTAQPMCEGFGFDPESGRLTFTWGADMPTTGTYSFKVTPYIAMQTAGGIAVQRDSMAKVITVKLVNTVPAANAVPAIIVSTDSPVGTARVTLKNSSDALLKTLTGGSVEMNALLKGSGKMLKTLETNPVRKAEAGKLYVEYVNGYIVVNYYPEVGTIAAGSYKFAYKPSFEGSNVEGAQIPVTVTVTNAKPSVTVAAVGALDTVQRNTGITYTVTKINNSSDRVSSDGVLVLDANNNVSQLFEADPIVFNAKGQATVMVHPKAGVAIPTGAQKYKLQFKMADSYGMLRERAVMQTALLSTSVRQTALKLTQSSTVALTMYQSNMSNVNGQRQAYTRKLTLAGPTNAAIEDVRINTAKTPAALVNALTGSGFGWTPIDDKSGEIRLEPNGSTGLKAGTTYNLVMDVYPVGMASNANPTQVTIQIKIAK